MRPIVFLDVDGVMNHYGSFARSEGSGLLVASSAHVLDPACVDRVLRLVRETDADVVLSSTWRLDARRGSLDALRAAGIRWVASTPVFGGEPRREEIYYALQVLDMHGTRPVIVLDDGEDASLLGHDRFRNRRQRPCLFVHTSMERGITEVQAVAAIEWAKTLTPTHATLSRASRRDEVPA